MKYDIQKHPVGGLFKGFQYKQALICDLAHTVTVGLYYTEPELNT